MPFDKESAVRARTADPKLSVYDTGEVLEPLPWSDHSGRVDYDDDFGVTWVTAGVEPSVIENDTVVLTITAHRRTRVMLNDVFVGATDDDGNWRY